MKTLCIGLASILRLSIVFVNVTPKIATNSGMYRKRSSQKLAVLLMCRNARVPKKEGGKVAAVAASSLDSFVSQLHSK